MERELIIDQSFDLNMCLHMGQDFRWRKMGGGWHSGVLRGNLIHIRQEGRKLEYRAHSDLSGLLTSYFRLDDDTDAIYADISSIDDRVASLVKKYQGLRILRQPDPWECMVAYICSATNSVGRISSIVEKIAEELGKPVELEGEVRHTFPTPDMVIEAGVGRLESLSLGLNRHNKIIAAAERIRGSKLDLCQLSHPDVSYAEAKRRLMGCRGIGPKIADCICLFALDKTEAFPVDRWVERATERYFPPQERPFGEDLVMWAQDRFGNNAGYANQFLFAEARK